MRTIDENAIQSYKNYIYTQEKSQNTMDKYIRDTAREKKSINSLTFPTHPLTINLSFFIKSKTQNMLT